MKEINRLLMGAALSLLCVTPSVHAVLASNAVLDFDDPVFNGSGNVIGGTFFSFDINNNNDLELFERFPMFSHDGIVLGTAQPVSGSHGGPPDGSESPGIDEPWQFFNNTGMHQSTAPVTVISASGNTALLDMIGWGMTWNSIPNIPLGSGIWGTNPESQAEVTCDVDCSLGDRFTLSYSAVVPEFDPSGFSLVRYRMGLVGSAGDSDPGLVLAGTVSQVAAVPLPSAVWLFGMGLMGLTGVARCKASRLG